MPTYDYQCDNCSHEMEAFQSITANPLKKCPECGKLKLKRLLGTGAGLIFKGSGFYETDYRSESYNKAAKADTETKADKKEVSSDSKSSPDTKSTSDTKPSAKKESPKSESKGKAAEA